eukprot:7850828-Lingulodinium_polyedra.AAC.1
MAHEAGQARVQVGSRRWLVALRGGPAAALRHMEASWRALWQRPTGPPPSEVWMQAFDDLPAFPARVPWTVPLIRT